MAKRQSNLHGGFGVAIRYPPQADVHPDARLVNVAGPARRRQQLEVAPNHACLADEVAGVLATRHNRTAEQQNDAFVAEQRVQCGRVWSARVSRRVASSPHNIDRFGLIVGRGVFRPVGGLRDVGRSRAGEPAGPPFCYAPTEDPAGSRQNGTGAVHGLARAANQQSGVDRSRRQGNARYKRMLGIAVGTDCRWRQLWRR